MGGISVKETLLGSSKMSKGVASLSMRLSFGFFKNVSRVVSLSVRLVFDSSKILNRGGISVTETVF